MLFTVIGVFGVLLVLSAYGLLSSGRLAAANPRYQLLNLVGTAGVLASLSVQWNLASFILNAAWLLIGMIGLLRIILVKRAV